MVRSILLRGFDQGMANRLGNYMEKHGLKFYRQCIPTKFSKSNNGRVLVEYKNENNEILSEEFDTCLLAIGRTPDTKKLGLDEAGVKLSKNGKIVVDELEQSSMDNIYAIGDCAEGRPELTPSAIMAGKLLSRRLFGGEKKFMDYTNVATTVFTPLEYGSVGLSEEDAYQKYNFIIYYRYGKENVKVYHSEFTPLEWTYNLEKDDTCYVKVIINTLDDNRVIGFHVLSPSAGEITQGISVAMKCGLTKEKLDETVGIHPTMAEVSI